MNNFIYNIFIPFDADDCCDHVLCARHNTLLDDEAAVAFLKNRVHADLKDAVQVALLKSFTKANYYSRCRIDGGHHLYDEVFQRFDNQDNPLFVATIVIDGEVKVDFSRHHGDPDFYLTFETVGCGQMDDWIIKYREGNTLNLPQLIKDDYFLAIEITYNAKLYVSSLKLLLSCIDSISYIEYGKQRSPSFIDWLNRYANLTAIGITAEELWELRNGVLHMTNLNSRQVVSQKVRRISVQIGGEGGTDADGVYYFDLFALIKTFSRALEVWLSSYNSNPNKFTLFVERYDETISDSRFLSQTNHDI